MDISTEIQHTPLPWDASSVYCSIHPLCQSPWRDQSRDKIKNFVQENYQYVTHLNVLLLCNEIMQYLFDEVDISIQVIYELKVIVFKCNVPLDTCHSKWCSLRRLSVGSHHFPLWWEENAQRVVNENNHTNGCQNMHYVTHFNLCFVCIKYI